MLQTTIYRHTISRFTKRNRQMQARSCSTLLPVEIKILTGKKLKKSLIEWLTSRSLYTLEKNLHWEEKSMIVQLNSDNEKSENYLPMYKSKVDQLEKYVVDHSSGVVARQQKLTEVRQELKKVIRARIHELVKYIFPISVVQPSRRWVYQLCFIF
ncbi:hypothetical protein J6590_058017 [Homalodisca vitripennis]|nr:hypothetical protein J6590_058017 [Homalodisca vitripennis]